MSDVQWRFVVTWEWRLPDGTTWHPDPPLVQLGNLGAARAKHRKVRDDPYGTGRCPQAATVMTVFPIVAEIRDVSDPKGSGAWRPARGWVSPDPAVDVFDHRDPAPGWEPTEGATG